jgi:hypothetical protein
VYLEFKWALLSGEARKPSRVPFVSSGKPEAILAEGADICQSAPRFSNIGGGEHQRASSWQADGVRRAEGAVGSSGGWAALFPYDRVIVVESLNSLQLIVPSACLAHRLR